MHMCLIKMSEIGSVARYSNVVKSESGSKVAGKIVFLSSKLERTKIKVPSWFNCTIVSAH